MDIGAIVSVGMSVIKSIVDMVENAKTAKAEERAVILQRLNDAFAMLQHEQSATQKEIAARDSFIDTQLEQLK